MTEEIMTVQDGLSELKLINQKLNRNKDLLRKYSSKMAADPDKIEDQEEYVMELMQSCEDLLKRYRAVKLAIAKSNLETEIEFKNEKFSVTEALFFKQGLIKMEEEYLASLNNTVAQQSIRTMTSQFSGKLDEEQLKGLKFVPKLFYDEKKKEKRLDELLEFRSLVDRLIDKSNHHTNITVTY